MKKGRHPRLPYIILRNKTLYVALNFSRTQATRANILSCWSAIFVDHSDALHIGSPNSFGSSVRMADFVPGYNTFRAYFTIFCHLKTPPSWYIHIKQRLFYHYHRLFASVLWKNFSSKVKIIMMICMEENIDTGLILLEICYIIHKNNNF